jgi:hypothetical protein
VQAYHAFGKPVHSFATTQGDGFCEGLNPSYALIGDDEDYRRHRDYCTINPVKHGLVGRVRDWPHPSFHRDVARRMG